MAYVTIDDAGNFTLSPTSGFSRGLALHFAELLRGLAHQLETLHDKADSSNRPDHPAVEEPGFAESDNHPNTPPNSLRRTLPNTYTPLPLFAPDNDEH